MFNQILALTWKDLKVFFKDKGAVIFIFLQPFMFIVIMSYATAGMYGSGDKPQQLLAVNDDQGAQATSIIKQLDEYDGFQVVTQSEGKPLTRAAAEQLVADGKYSIALVFPFDFSDVLEQSIGAQNARTTKIAIIVDPATPSYRVDPIVGTLRGLLERATLTVMMPRGIDLMFTQFAPQTAASEREKMKADAQRSMSGGLVGGQEPVVTIEKTTPPNMRVTKFPDTFQQNVPGYTIYGIFWIVTLLASSVLQEKRDGTFRRLLVAPMNRAAMLGGKMLPYYIINLLQIVIMIGASSLLFGLKLGSSPDGLVVVSLAVALTSTGMGVFLAALAKSEAQIGGLGTLLLLTMSALGGSFVPRFTMPDWLKSLGLLTPHAWALDAYQDLLVRGYNLVEVLPKVGVLGLFALAFFAVGVWKFRFE